MGIFDDIPPENGPRNLGQPEELTALEKVAARVNLPGWMDNLRGAAPFRVMQGMADPVAGAVQTVANLLPESTGVPGAVNQRIADVERRYQDARLARGDEGFDAARFTGNVLSPVNAAIAARAPMAATAGARALQGAGIGAATAGMEPIADASDGFWGRKAGQVAAGAAAGAVLTPIMGKVADRVVARLRLDDPASVAARSGAETDAAIFRALHEMGQDMRSIPPAQLQEFRRQVLEALGSGKQVDPAALMRKADFDALGIKPTLGQVTRDPRQFTREKRLAGVENLGEDLSLRFQQQGERLQQLMAARAEGAQDAYTAGGQITGSLRNVDDLLGREVNARYSAARKSAGKDLDVPLQGLAQDYAQILEDFGDKIPGALRSRFAALGLDPSLPSNQKSVFTIQNADHLLKVINSHVGNDPATNRALSLLRGAVKDAVGTADSTGGPFAPAVKAAAERFKLQDAAPGLKAAVEGTVAPEDFVQRYILGGKVGEVRELANILKQSDPAAYNEARAQIADTLKRAAFGINTTGDASFRPSAFAETMRKLGPQKLSAFFNAEEFADLMRIGRVGAYIGQAPNAAAVNTSNTASAVTNLLQRLPGVSPVVGLGTRAVNSMRDQSEVRNALAAALDAGRAPLSDRQRDLARFTLAGGAAAAGSSAGSSKRK